MAPITTPIVQPNHTANYKGCEYYIKLKNKFSGQRRLTQPQDQTSLRPFTSSIMYYQPSSANTNTYAYKLCNKATPSHSSPS